MTVKTKPFDSSEYLETPEDIHEYLKAICEEGDSDLFLIALGHIAKAKGMTEIARLSGLSRQNLYRSLAPGGEPKYETIKKVVEAIGCKLTVA